jgi:hypothetical protein
LKISPTPETAEDIRICIGRRRRRRRRDNYVKRIPKDYSISFKLLTAQKDEAKIAI